MNHSLKLITLTLLSGLTFNSLALDHTSHSTSPGLQSTQRQVVSTRGVVNGIDADAKKVTITHEAIPALGWPEMTMRFTFNDVATLGSIKVGDRVVFNFIQQGNISLLENIGLAQ